MIKVSALKKTYDRGSRHANTVLHDVSFTLPDTGFVCILGASGCGKTSLLNAIGGLDRFDSGCIETGSLTAKGCGGAAFEAERNRSFGYIFQNYYLLMDHSVAYNVYLGLHSLDLSHREKLRRVREALRAVEMEQYLRRKVGELSGGQQQRVAIARAIARKPRVIFADEPTGNLDEANTLNICALLRSISKTSLVLMVTHERRIANFFADRIITLDSGRIVSDRESWERGGLAAEDGRSLYAGDYRQSRLNGDGISLRLLREEGAEEISLTLVALRDRIVIKLDDPRAIVCGGSEQAPVLQEGKAPCLTLEQLDAGEADSPLFSPEEEAQTAAGKGLSPGMMLREAVSLFKGRGLKKLGMMLFLVLISLLSAFTVSDYLTVASIDPEDFITSHSQMLELRIEQGDTLYGDGKAFTPVLIEYMDYLRTSGEDFRLVPHVSPTMQYSVDLFRQMDSVSMKLDFFSYVPLEALDETSLIHGRMPQSSEEIVVDRWVLEKAIERDGILQNSIYDVSYFLGAQLGYSKLSYAPIIVGISDCGQPAVFMDTAALVSIGVNGTPVTPLSQLKARYPGQFDHIELGEGECIAIANNAGVVYYNRIGGVYQCSTRLSFTVTDCIEADVGGCIVVDDSQVETILWDMVYERLYLYCPDKEAILDFLGEKGSEMEQNGHAIVRVIDSYESDYSSHASAARSKADSRAIVTVTVIALSIAMLYLLCRAQTRERIGMLAVYRLLGIPGRKILGIFAMESLMGSLALALPGVAAMWAAINLAALVPEWEMSLILPWQAAAAVFAVIALCHMAVSLLPPAMLLRLPPARLAAKYDI